MFFRRLATRQRRPELMDQPDLDPSQLRLALKGIARVNRLSFSSRLLWRSIRHLAKQTRPRPLRVLDLACGSGDVAITLASRARAAKLAVQITGCDINPVAIEFARQKALDSGADIRFHTLDVLNEDLPSGFDIVTCSLFLHHLEEKDAERVLRKMRRATRQLVLVNDLVRSRWGFLLAWVGTRVLSRSPIVHFDGPVSVEGAFTRAEAQNIAERAGLHGATVRRRWPFRYLLSWSRP